jgi:hypothetical protein
MAVSRMNMRPYHVKGRATMVSSIAVKVLARAERVV